jgi:hypothetical protein
MQPKSPSIVTNTRDIIVIVVIIIVIGVISNYKHYKLLTPYRAGYGSGNALELYQVGTRSKSSRSGSC